jgi:hypothetical protein
LRFELFLAVADEQGEQSQVSLGHLERGEVEDVVLLGLKLSEGKQLMERLQHEIVTRQVEAMRRPPCTGCGASTCIKDYHGARFRSLFGDVELRVPRYAKCECAISAADGRQARRRWGVGRTRVRARRIGRDAVVRA